MNTKIEVYENNTNESGTYQVWYKDQFNNSKSKVITESELNALLNMGQKSDLFMGRWKFTIDSEYDFKKTFLNQ